MKHFLNSLVISTRLQYWLFTIALWLPNVVMTFTEPLPWYTCIVQLLLGLGAFSALMSLGKNPGRQLYVLFVFIFFAAFQLVLLWLYGNSPISVDMFLNLVSTNANEAGELLGNIIVGVLIVCSFYIAILWLAAASWRRNVSLDRHWRQHIRRMFALPVFVGSTAVCILLQATTSFSLRADVYPVHVSYNAGMAIYRFLQLQRYDSQAADFVFGAASTRADTVPETYVLVIGETTRSVNLGLYGYERETTPRLSAREGLLTYTDVLSQSNTTHKSVPLLLTAAEAADPSPMYNEKSIIAAFREAGFHTTYISNQADNGSLIDHYSREANVRRYLRQEYPDELPNDALILSALAEELANARQQHRKNLFVLHLYGSHFKYCERAPEAYRLFTPCDDVQLSVKNREQLVNAFDNSILYTDMVVDSIMTLADSDTPTMVLFTSDHGEDLYDDERNNFLHASPIVDFYQLAVPLLIWPNKAYNKHYPNQAANMAARIAAPLSPARIVFHTMLDAAGIECRALQRDHSLCDSSYVCGERLFLSDRNEPLGFDQLHLTENDYLQMDKYNISH